MAKKNTGRPLKGDEPATQRVSALLTENEKAKLDQIAAEKKWPRNPGQGLLGEMLPPGFQKNRPWVSQMARRARAVRAVLEETKC